MACNHDHFDVTATVVRSSDKPCRFKVDLKVVCIDCNQPFRFGRSYVSSTDGLEMTALLWPGALKINRQLPDEVSRDIAAWGS